MKTNIEPLITSVLDNDLYKFTMGYAVLKNFEEERVKYKLFVRTKVKFPKHFAQALREQIDMMASLKLSAKELDRFHTACPFLPRSFFLWLETFRYDPRTVTVMEEDGEFVGLSIEGLWCKVIYWEVPLMAIISELYFRMKNPLLFIKERDYLKTNDWYMDMHNKFGIVAELNIPISELGTRRRASKRHQQAVAQFLFGSKRGTFVGTSNVALALEHGGIPQGSVAHEWSMFFAAKYGYENANAMAMDVWTETFNGKMGIALSDTFTTDVFFRSFDGVRARVYDGVRHDSGDPYAFFRKTVEHYKSIGIDPTTKVISFTNGLTLDDAVAIWRYCRGELKKTAFGLGTFLTNDVNGFDALNMVIKMTALVTDNGDIGTVKLSDDIGKSTGKPEDVELCKKELGIDDEK